MVQRMRSVSPRSYHHPREAELVAYDSLISSFSLPVCNLATYCNPYCNRAGTCWYGMDKTTSADRRKPP